MCASNSRAVTHSPHPPRHCADVNIASAPGSVPQWCTWGTTTCQTHSCSSTNTHRCVCRRKGAQRAAFAFEATRGEWHPQASCSLLSCLAVGRERGLDPAGRPSFCNDLRTDPALASLLHLQPMVQPSKLCHLVLSSGLVETLFLSKDTDDITFSSCQVASLAEVPSRPLSPT